MKRLLTGLIAVLALVLAAPAYAQDTGWVIENFAVSMDVSPEAEILVDEKIEVDFNQLEKHGIYRTIPLQNTDNLGNLYKLRFSVREVTLDNQQKVPYSESYDGEGVTLKIGDADSTITGKHTYRIRYKIERGLRFFPNETELYWNVTGNEWPVPIESAEVTIAGPGSILDSVCYLGPLGATDTFCDKDLFDKGIRFSSKKEMLPGDGLTVAVRIDPSSITQPDQWQELKWFFSDNWPYFIPVMTMGVLLWLYWQEGRDRQYKHLFDPTKGIEPVPLIGHENIPRVYEPLKELLPAEAGTLIDEEVHMRDIASTLIDLAVKGYLTIKQTKDKTLFSQADYELTVKNDAISGLTDYEQDLLKSLFPVLKIGSSTSLSELKYSFADKLTKIKTAIYDRLTDKGLFVKQPEKVVQKYRVIGILLAVGGMFGPTLAWKIALIVSGALFFMIAKAMPQKTGEGRKALLQTIGLKQFVALGAYREKIWEKANLFEEVLPYAIAFDLTHQWAAAFAQTAMTKPQWYEGTGSFNSMRFASSMEEFTRSTAVTLPATKSSSGSSGFSGGSSGGGFGGGGGGSW